MLNFTAGLVQSSDTVRAASTAAGLVPMWLLPPSFWRIVATTVCVEAALLPLTWFFMFDDLERSFVRTKLLSRLPVVGERFK